MGITLKDIHAQRAMIERGESQSRRDRFACAAMAGLAATIPVNSVYHQDIIANQAYGLADAMLRERERTNHDAVPEAKAYADGEPAPKRGGEAGLSSRDGTGNTQRPVAWARFFPNGGPQSVYLDRPPPDAEPLYRSPTLTDSEREAIEAAIVGRLELGDFATLRTLLERIK
jgi:hypothetical protein